MSRMIDDEEELKDYGLIEKCSNLVTDENKCLDTWDDENADYKECKRINCYKKQLQRAKAEKQDLINYFKLREGGMQEDIQYWKNKAQEQYRELKQYKASKQASYESMQAEWNDAVNELRELKATDKIEFKQYYKAENERLKADIEELKEYNDSYDKDVRALLSENDKLKAENEKLKSRNKLYKKIIKENIEKANNNLMILTACLQGNLSIEEVKEYAKLNNKNDELKRKLKSYKQAFEEVEKYCNECNLKADYTACEVLRIIDEVVKCRH